MPPDLHKLKKERRVVLRSFAVSFIFTFNKQHIYGGRVEKEDYLASPVRAIKIDEYAAFIMFSSFARSLSEDWSRGGKK